MNSSNLGIPMTLLNASIQDKLAYFKAKQVKHRKVEGAAITLREILNGNQCTIANIFGPTGIGKSTLLEKMVAHLEANPKQKQRDGDRPVILETAATAIGKANVYRDLFNRLILNIHGANNLRDENAIQVIEKLLLGRETTVSSKLMRKLENAIRVKNVEVIFIDEAQHLKAGKSGQLLQEQMDVLKYLTDKTGIKLVLCGTYELRLFASLSGQAARRSRNVHFERYLLNDADIEEFKNIILTFQKALPLEEEPQLIDQWEFLYEKSIGCVGILKDLLNAALAKALTSGAKTIAVDILHSVALDNNSLIQIIKEASEGEGLCNADQSSTLRRLVYGAKNNKAVPVPEITEKIIDKRKRRIGQQKPAIIPVGDGTDA